MDKYSQAAELCQIYSEMDAEGKEKIVSAATQLLKIQKVLENKEFPAKNAVLASTQKEVEGETAAFDRKSPRASRFDGVTGYFMMGILLLFAAHFFWVTLISPAMFIPGDTPIAMIRIILTASIGFLCIGVCLYRFMFWKLTVPWVLLAICAGILCVDPGFLTDLVGFAIIALIVAAQVINWKRDKTAVAV